MNDDLLSAISTNDISTASSLIARGIEKPEKHAALLAAAARDGHIELMTLLINAGVPMNNACHAAIRNGQLAALMLLIERGANLAELDAQQTALLVCACDRPGDQFALALLDAGASIDNLTPDQLIDLAATSVAVLNRLLALNVNVAALRSKNNRTVIHELNTRRTVDVAALLDVLVRVCRVDIDAHDRMGLTACHRLAVFQNETMLRLLIEHGADIDRAKVTDGRTALHILCDDPDSAASSATLLLAAGANLSLTDDQGQTPCHCAADAGSDVLAPLIAAGADLDQPDNSGQTPRHIAAANSVALPSDAEIEGARRRIAAVRLDFVRQRALEVCIGLHSLDVNALQLCEIMLHSCGPLAPIVRFHHWWKIATIVKHFRHNE
jgi:ankyrin repeat protein